MTEDSNEEPASLEELVSQPPLGARPQILDDATNHTMKRNDESKLEVTPTKGRHTNYLASSLTEMMTYSLN